MGAAAPKQHQESWGSAALTEHGCEVAHRQRAPHGQPRDGEPPANGQILGQLLQE